MSIISNKFRYKSIQKSLLMISLIDTGVTIETEGESLPVPLSHNGLALVLTHLAGNAAAAGATEVRLTAHRDDAGALTLRVADNGPGISAGNRDRVFEPFFTTRRDTGGTGMGLAIVQTKLLAHGASIELVDAPGGGTVFLIRF